MKNIKQYNSKNILRGAALSCASILAISMAVPAVSAQVATVSKVIEIESQSLDGALNELAQQAGTQIVFYSDDAKGYVASKIDGTYTIEEVLSLLLDPAGLSYQYINERTIAVAPAERFAQVPSTEASSSSSQGTNTIQNNVTPTANNAPIPNKISFTDEVIVTALKREQNLQDVPASISAFSALELEQKNIDSIRDIARQTPNFLGSSFTSTQPIFAIRGGANTLSAIGTSEPVGVYIDEVYLPRFSSADFELFDLKSVEVLRGPQGTFFGRNVASGAVVITTKKPSLEENIVKVQASYGNYNSYELKGLVNGKLSDNVAGKVSISRVERDGFGRDAISGEEQDDLHSTSVRGSLLWQPNEQFEAILSGDYTDDGNGGRTLSTAQFGADPDPRVSNLGVSQNFDRKIYGGSLRMTYDTENGEFISITGFRKSSSDELFSFNGISFTLLPFAFQQVDQDLESPQTISQELRFVSDEFENFNFIAGIFYLNEDSDRIVNRRRLLNGNGAVIQNVQFDQNIKTNAYAAYVDGTYHITDNLDLSGGVRYTFENRIASLNYTDNINTANSFSVTGLEENFDSFTPRIALTYKPTDDITLYGSISKGFTAGGFNTEADSLGEIITPFQEETITSYEGGIKTSFWNNRGYANVVYFYQNYNDKQEFVFDFTTFVGTILNAADATIQGIEVEVGLQLNEFFSIDANYGYLDTVFDRFPIANTPGNTGNELGNSPGNQFAISGTFEHPVMDGAVDFFANANYSWTDDYFTGGSNNPDLFVESYGLLGANIGVSSANDRWKFELFGTNLTDKEFVLTPSNFIVIAQTLGAPRQYGARLTLKY